MGGPPFDFATTSETLIGAPYFRCAKNVDQPQWPIRTTNFLGPPSLRQRTGRRQMDRRGPRECARCQSGKSESSSSEPQSRAILPVAPLHESLEGAHDRGGCRLNNSGAQERQPAIVPASLIRDTRRLLLGRSREGHYGGRFETRWRIST